MEAAEQSLSRLLLPVFSENTRSATIVKVLVAVGERVSEGTPLFEMVTEKAEFEFTSTAAGVVQTIFASENAEVPAGYVLALVGEAAPSAAEFAACEVQNRQMLAAFSATIDATGLLKEPPSGPAGGAPVPSGLRATPAARRLAREKGVDLTNVKRILGIDGILREQDVARYLEGEVRK